MGGAAARLSCCAHYAMSGSAPATQTQQLSHMPAAFPVLPRSGHCATRESVSVKSRSQRRFFDMVLLSHELEMASIRINELINCVDAMVFVQTPWRFSDGSHKSVEFPAGLPPRVHHMVVSDNISSCLSSQIPRWCRQIIARNFLGRAFHELGGTDDDWAIVSDADEIPTPEALQRIRDLPAGSEVVGPNATHVVALKPIHNFKFGVHCEEKAGHTTGSTVASGGLLRRTGAQAMRRAVGSACKVGKGFWASCQARPTLNWEHSCWHFSSISGGADGFIEKARSNSQPDMLLTGRLVKHHISSTDSPAYMAETYERAREEVACMDLAPSTNNESSNGPIVFANVLKTTTLRDLIHRGGLSRRRTPWNSSHLPTYPDVPRVVELSFAQGLLQHWLGNWSTFSQYKGPSGNWSEFSDAAVPHANGPVDSPSESTPIVAADSATSTTIAPSPDSKYEPTCLISGPQRALGRTPETCMRAGVIVTCRNESSSRGHNDVSKSGSWQLDQDYHYALDVGLASGFGSQFAGSTVLELGGGKGCYASAVLRTGRVPEYRVYDGSNAYALTDGFVGRADLTQELDLGVSDWVLCLEVAEHVPKVHEGLLLRNWHAHNRRGLVISWASPFVKGNGHVNPRESSWVKARIEAMGYRWNSTSTNLLSRSVRNLAWLRNVLVFDRL